jgi:hypothetical protein
MTRRAKGPVDTQSADCSSKLGPEVRYALSMSSTIRLALTRLLNRLFFVFFSFALMAFFAVRNDAIHREERKENPPISASGSVRDSCHERERSRRAIRRPKKFKIIFFFRFQARDLRQIHALPDLTTCHCAARLWRCLGVRAIDSGPLGVPAPSPDRSSVWRVRGNHRL